LNKKKEKGISFKLTDEVFNNLEELSKLKKETKTKIIENSINEMMEFYSKIEFIQKTINEKGECYLITPETNVRGFTFDRSNQQFSNEMIEIRVEMRIRKFDPKIDVQGQRYYDSDLKYTLEKDYIISRKNSEVFYLPRFRDFGKSISQLLRKDRGFNIASINIF
jgi:hypothetical protein